MKRSRATGPGEVPAPGQDASAEPATTPTTGPDPASDPSFRRAGGADDSTDALFRRPDADADLGEDFTWESGAEARREPAPFLQPESGGRRPAPFLQPEPGGRPGPFGSPEPDGRAGADDADDEDAGDTTPPVERTAPLPLDEPDPARPPGGGPALGVPAGAPVSAPVADGPAGLDPAEAAARPPAGRRGRLRRRLRYLRRARELMLRDLGGLVYEIHRTGGGDMPAHAGLMAGKIERLATLDAEAHALEAVLAAPREQVALFEPGVGGTCDACGELYGSDARFCSRCGTPTSGELQPLERAAAPSAASERAPTLAGPAPEPHPPMPEEPPEPAAPGAEAATSMLPAAGGDQPTQAISGPVHGSDEEERGDAADETDDDRTRALNAADETDDDRTRALNAADETDDDRTRSLNAADETDDDGTPAVRDADGRADEPDADESRTRSLRPAGPRRRTDEDDRAPDRDTPPADGGEGERTPPPGEVLRWRERRG